MTLTDRLKQALTPEDMASKEAGLSLLALALAACNKSGVSQVEIDYMILKNRSRRAD